MTVFGKPLNIWSIDGDDYVAMVPPKPLLKELHLIAPGSIEESHTLDKFVISDESIKCDESFSAVDGMFALYVPEKEEEVLWFMSKWHNPDRISYKETKIAFRPLLVPLSKDGTVSSELKISPTGTITEGGCIRNVMLNSVWKEPFPTKMPFLPELGLTSGNQNHTLPNVYHYTYVGDSELNKPSLTWICVDGMLLASENLFATTAVELWQLGYCIPQSVIPKLQK